MVLVALEQINLAKNFAKLKMSYCPITGERISNQNKTMLASALQLDLKQALRKVLTDFAVWFSFSLIGFKKGDCGKEFKRWMEVPRDLRNLIEPFLKIGDKEIEDAFLDYITFVFGVLDGKLEINLIDLTVKRIASSINYLNPTMPACNLDEFLCLTKNILTDLDIITWYDKYYKQVLILADKIYLLLVC